MSGPIIISSGERTVDAKGTYKSTISVREGAQLTLIASDSAEPEVGVYDTSKITANYTGYASGALRLYEKSDARIFVGGNSAPIIYIYNSSVLDITVAEQAHPSIFCHSNSRAYIVSTGDSNTWLTFMHGSIGKIAVRGKASLYLRGFDYSQLEVNSSERSYVNALTKDTSATCFTVDKFSRLWMTAYSKSNISVKSLQSSLVGVALCEQARLCIDASSKNPAKVTLGGKSHLSSKGLVTVGVEEYSKVVVNGKMFSTIKEGVSSGI
jgi:hypothetical protein